MSAPAHVVQIPARPWESHGNIVVECRKCCIEWGWARDTAAMFDRLKVSATEHNKEQHQA